MKWLSRFLAVGLILALSIGNSVAQRYPSKTVRLVVNMPAGGGVDMAARLIGQKLSESWKQPVVIDNRGGAGGSIGADGVAKAAPDGHTLLVAHAGMTMLPNLYRKLPFDALKDFEPISQIYSSFVVLVVNANVPASSIRELVALAKAKPGSLSYGHNGVGATLHLTMELFKMATDTNILAVPYKGAAPVTTALLTREVDMAFTGPAPILTHVKAGKLRALAITKPARSPLLPEVPTMAEAGIRDVDFELPEWVGLFAPAGTPRDIVQLIQQDVAKALEMPDVRNRILESSQEPVGSTPEEFDAKYKESLAKFARVAKEFRIQMQE